MFDVNRLTIIAISAPIPNQNIKNPTVAISPTKNSPAIINHNFHIVISPLFLNLHLYYTINEYKNKYLCKK